MYYIKFGYEQCEVIDKFDFRLICNLYLKELDYTYYTFDNKEISLAYKLTDEDVELLKPYI